MELRPELMPPCVDGPVQQRACELAVEAIGILMEGGSWMPKLEELSALLSNAESAEELASAFEDATESDVRDHVAMLLQSQVIRPKKMTDSEMAELVRRITDPSTPEPHTSWWMNLLEISIPNPHITNLIFHDKRNLDPEGVVREAKKYRVIQL